MPVSKRVPDAEIQHAYESTGTIRGAMRLAGVSHATVMRALGRTRKAEDFQKAIAVNPPTQQQPPYAWDLEAIRNARDSQLRGNFKQPVRLAEALRTDDILFVAYHARLAPLSSIGTRLCAANGSRGEAVARRAAESVIVPRHVLVGIAGTLANHGIAIGYVKHTPNDEGTRVEMRLEEWPLEHVRWDNSREVLQTAVKNANQTDIVHGDGQWIVFRKFGTHPWTQDACVLPAALLWAAHANGIKDWAATSSSHAIANKMMGELPAGTAMQNADGTLTPEANAFLQMIVQIASGQSPAGIRPSGSKTDFISNTSTAWQIFDAQNTSREKAAARIYTGTDAILGSNGGAPGVDISQLFGVATTKIQGDVEAIEQGLSTGLYQPWTAINEGDSRLAPSLEFLLPDPDAEQKSEQNAAKRARLMAAIDAEKKAGMVVDQPRVNALAAEFGVTNAPALAPIASYTVPLTLAPTDSAKVVRVSEARKSQGLEPFGDIRDNMTIPELDAYIQAKSAAPPGGSEGTGPKVPATLAGEFDEHKHPRADDGKFGHGGGGGSGGSSGAPRDAQSHFDETAKAAGEIANSGGHHAAVDAFLNHDRHAASIAERNGTEHAASVGVNRFLHDARAKGAVYKGPVYRGTTQAELDRILAGNANTTTWSVSKDPEGSAHFAKKGGVLLVMPGGAGAVPVDGISGSNTFNEALLPKGAKFRVKAQRQKGSVKIVTLEPAT